MIIKFILISGLCTIFLYAISQRKRSFIIAHFIALATVVGAFFVLFPNAANDVAGTIGVGRGADLVLYLFVLSMLAIVFNIHLRLRVLQETMTEFARLLAILTARDPTERAEESERAKKKKPQL